jgi:ACS family glucarate transporter-like MFS transporter
MPQSPVFTLRSRRGLSCHSKFFPVSHPASSAASTVPTRKRHWVVVFAISLAMICYIDRVIIAQATPTMRADLNLSIEQWGWILGIFSWAYTLCEIPGGWMGDKWGARKVLLRVVTFWSFFTAATGWAWNYVSLFVCRLLFGAGEAGCFPNLTKAFTVWLPVHERVRAQGLMWFAARWGGAVTPFMVALLLQHMHWRRVFEIFGVLGVIWAVFFFRWYRDDPRSHPDLNDAEKALLPKIAVKVGHGDVPWRKILRNRSVLLLWLQYFLLSYGWWFYIQWLPSYLREARGFTLERDALLGALLAGVPLFLGGIGCWVSGHFSPLFARWFGSVSGARKVLGCGGLTAAGLLLVVSVQIQNPILAMIAMGFASFANDLTIPCSWGACMDIGRTYAGSVSGGMNMGGAGGGAVAGPMVAYILIWTDNNWNVPLYVAAIVYGFAALCWLGIDSTTPLELDEVKTSAT